ncbi:MAG TPA: glycosyltransferase [Aliidongia sp.]|nr:glycosyltransferase [Aliidongia sp.]
MAIADTQPELNAELPAVDVILLSWNRVEDTIAAIESCLEQQGVTRRIFIVDQGSEPEQLARLDAFVAGKSDVMLNKLGRNLGVAGGRNAASDLGRSPYIVALDSDAIFADTRMLERAVAYMAARPQLCAIGFRITNFFTRENDPTSWDYPPGVGPAEHFSATRFIGAGHCIRRSVFEQVGKYDDRLFFCGEELDLCYRMLNAGYRIDYVPTVEILHKVSPEARVFWDRGRFRLTVRNNLYTLYKFGTPFPRLALAAAAFTVKAARNGIAMEAVKGSWQSLAMCAAFRRSPEDKNQYRLKPETWRYILECEPMRRDGFVTKLRRQFYRLPHQAPTGS